MLCLTSSSLASLLADFEKGTVEEEDKSNLREVEDGGESTDDEEEEGGGGGKKEGTVSFEIESIKVENVKKTCIELDYPLMEEYDFRSDRNLKDIPNFNLRPETRIRRYQERSLSKMFGNGRARRGGARARSEATTKAI